MKRLISVFLLVLAVSSARAADWQDWDLGGELGLGVGSGSKKGRIMSPALTLTGTRQYDDMLLELGAGILFGTDEITNFTEEEIDEFIDGSPLGEYTKADFDYDQLVEAKLTIVPFTVNFIYSLYESFYVGGGVGLYNVFYKEVPLGNYRVNTGQTEEEKGVEVKSPSSTTLGLQQVVGVEVFPMSPNWSWFVGIKSFWMASAPQTGSILGVTIGGKARYSW